MKQGIDISKWQGDFDLKNSKAQFVIIKAGGSDDGLYIDSQFLNNYSKAKNLGLPCGLYWYTRAMSTAKLKEEIRYLTDAIKGLQFELPLFLDLEEDILYNNAADWALTWLAQLPALGYYPGIYSSLSWWNDALKDIAKSIPQEQRWLALWGDYDDPGYVCGIWQNGHIYINGMEVDSDIMYSDYSFIKNAGLNGFKEKQYFSDVTADRKDYNAIQWAASRGYIKGYSNGTFRPDQPLTRGQLCTILYRMAGKP